MLDIWTSYYRQYITYQHQGYNSMNQTIRTLAAEQIEKTIDIILNHSSKYRCLTPSSSYQLQFSVRDSSNRQLPDVRKPAITKNLEFETLVSIIRKKTPAATIA